MKKEFIILGALALAAIAGHKAVASKTTDTPEITKPHSPEPTNPSNNVVTNNTHTEPEVHYINNNCVEVGGQIRCMGLRQLPAEFKKTISEKTHVDWNAHRIVKLKCDNPNACMVIYNNFIHAIKGAKSYDDVVNRTVAEFRRTFGVVPNYPSNLWYTLAFNLYTIPSKQQNKYITVMNYFNLFSTGILKPVNPTPEYFSKTWLPR